MKPLFVYEIVEPADYINALKLFYVEVLILFIRVTGVTLRSSGIFASQVSGICLCNQELVVKLCRSALRSINQSFIIVLSKTSIADTQGRLLPFACNA